MTNITVHLIKPNKGTTVTYQAEVLSRAAGYVLVQARWERPRLELGYTTFETGDIFFEHFYAERWYNIFELRSTSGALKGWYCNVTCPAEIGDDTVISTDLALDLFVPPDRIQPLRLDVDEFEALGLAASDPATYAAAYGALDELERLALAGESPFDRE